MEQDDFSFLGKQPPKLNRAKLLQEAWDFGIRQGVAGRAPYKAYADNPDLQGIYEEGWDKGDAKRRRVA